MKKVHIVALILVFFSSCNRDRKVLKTNHSEPPVSSRILLSEFQSIIDSAGVKGAILLYDLKEDIYYSNDFQWANEEKLPASTFKIANTIIALETGVVESDSTIFKWDGKPRGNKDWEQDLILRDAFQLSCVPCYQVVAREIGSERMNRFLHKLDYGTMDVNTNNIDNFWLIGNSRISQMQQIDFLKRLHAGKLPISDHTVKIMGDIMAIDENNQYRLSGKSGISTENNNYNGWFVGYIETTADIFFFAINIEPKGKVDFDTFVKKRKEISVLALKQMKIIS